MTGRNKKGPWQKALEHLVVGAALIVSAATWAPKTIAGSFLISAGVDQATSWAKPAGPTPTSFITSPVASLEQYSYRATRFTLESAARVAVWLTVFVGMIAWGIVELRLMIGCIVDGMIDAARRAAGMG